MRVTPERFWGEVVNLFSDDSIRRDANSTSERGEERIKIKVGVYEDLC